MNTSLLNRGAPELRRLLITTAIGALLASSAAVVMAVPAGAVAAPSTIFVDPGGVDSPTCGAAVQACLTIQHGIDRATSGQTVQVAAGTYNESVTIDKGVNLQGAGAGVSIIDGTGVAAAGLDGLVNIRTTDGDVTISGFTIENPVVGAVFGPHSISLLDPTVGDHVTISHNTILGWANDPDLASDAQNGIDSANTFAQTTITDNDISGVFQGVLLEGNRGALDVSNNHIHDLTPFVDGDTKFPAEGVYVLSDKQSSASDQNVTNNTFDHFNGIGIAYSAGYDLAGCSESTCNGSVTGSITNNTFALSANGEGFASASAIRLRAIHTGDALHLAIGGNTGTVVAPTQTIEETPNDGSIAVTPTAEQNMIVTDPAPTVGVDTPESVTTGEPALGFTGSVTNTSGEDFAHARYEIALTGDPGLNANDVTLKYSAGDAGFLPVPLSGSTTDGGAITGQFGPAAGFNLADGATPSTDFTVSIANGAPGGTLTTAVRLVEVSQGTGHPVLNTLATDTDTSTIIANQAPTASDVSETTTAGHPVAVTLAGHDADGDSPLSFDHGDPEHGTLTGTGSNLTYTPAVGFAGPDSFTYTVTDTVSDQTSSPATVSITVNKVTATLGVQVIIGKISPTHVRLLIDVNAPGALTHGMLVRVKEGTRTLATRVVHGQVDILFSNVAKGVHSWTISSTTSASATAASKTVTFRVLR